MICFDVDGISFRVYDHIFAVSRCGKVLRKFQPYTPYIRRDGYVACGHGNRLLHRMVAHCWLEGFNPRKQVHHIDGDRKNNGLDNLEPLTQREHLLERHADILANNGKYVRTPESREKIRQARLGSVTSDETKAKQSAALKGRKRPYFARAAHSQESKEKRSLSHPKNLSCRIDGVEYRSFAEASRATGVHRFTVRSRCLSENFPNYEAFL